MAKTAQKKKAPANKKTSKKRVDKKPRGRPSSFSEDAAMKVLEGIMGGDSLEKACEKAPAPTKRTWLRWVAADVKLQLRYVAAMQIRALGRADECVPLVDGVREDKQAIAKVREQVKARQWEIQRLQNKVYGRDGVVEENAGDTNLAARLKAARNRVKEQG